MQTVDPIDFRGREVKGGDTLIYPVRRGASMYLNQITVEEILYDGLKPIVCGYNSGGRKVQIQNISNTISFPKEED